MSNQSKENAMVDEPCGVCSGKPLSSGRKCICGGRGTLWAEAQGLRERVVDLEIALGMFPNVSPQASKAYSEVREALEVNVPASPPNELIIAARTALSDLDGVVKAVKTIPNVTDVWACVEYVASLPLPFPWAAKVGSSVLRPRQAKDSH